jgi:hypothetical protein
VYYNLYSAQVGVANVFAACSASAVRWYSTSLATDRSGLILEQLSAQNSTVFMCGLARWHRSVSSILTLRDWRIRDGEYEAV